MEHRTRNTEKLNTGECIQLIHTNNKKGELEVKMKGEDRKEGKNRNNHISTNTDPEMIREGGKAKWGQHSTEQSRTQLRHA